ncbi:hypothetical protein [Marivita sp. GX14005]|uniref:hypothetical protein n=1 Tax=Marivita sp. GX14005 TaxID=2942276 RepID=UPI002019CC87|nr:hypothetical protein [Marivita sp. GX14005]MCL3881171.1 hypothetical protein [Marivita sp. GX14005]
MIRTVLIAATMFGFSNAALAQGKEAECRKQGQIATDIMSQRKAGANAKRATAQVIGKLPEDARNYESAIPALVEWIYSLPEEQMTPEVSNALYQVCLSQ